MKRIIVLGSLNIDLVVPVERPPRIGETLAGGDVTIFAGGKGANQACAVARLDGAVHMVGQVGDDAFGESLVQNLKTAGVDTSGVHVSQRPTGSAYIFVYPGGDNSIVISSGANATLSKEMAVKRLAAAAPYSFLLGQLETPMATVVAAFAEAKRTGATTLLDPAPVQPLPAELLRNVDILMPNQTEAAALLGNASDIIEDFDDASVAADALLSSGYRGVVLKLGNLGCYVATSEIRTAIPAFASVAVDATGAGDAFSAAFAVAFAEGASFVEAALFANAAGAITVTRPGAQESIPTRAEVDNFLAARKREIRL